MRRRRRRSIGWPMRRRDRLDRPGGIRRRGGQWPRALVAVRIRSHRDHRRARRPGGARRGFRSTPRRRGGAHQLLLSRCRRQGDRSARRAHFFGNCPTPRRQARRDRHRRRRRVPGASREGIQGLRDLPAAPGWPATSPTPTRSRSACCRSIPRRSTRRRSARPSWSRLLLRRQGGRCTTNQRPTVSCCAASIRMSRCRRSPRLYGPAGGFCGRIPDVQRGVSPVW